MNTSISNVRKYFKYCKGEIILSLKKENRFIIKEEKIVRILNRRRDLRPQLFKQVLDYYFLKPNIGKGIF